MKRLIISLLYIINLGLVQAQVDTLWTRTFGSNLEDILSDLVNTDDGFLLVGSSAEFTEPENDFFGDPWIVKTNYMGEEQWNSVLNLYSGNEYEGAKSALMTEDGGFVMTGEGIPQNDGRCFLVKIDSIGTQQWFHLYGGYSGYSVIPGIDGGFLIGAIKFDNTTTDLWIIKTDDDGNLIWDTEFINDGGEYDFGGIISNNDGYVVFGRTNENGSEQSSLIRIDSLGNQSWAIYYDNSEYEYPFDIIENYSSGWILFSILSSSNGLKIISIDSTGQIIWETSYDNIYVPDGSAIKTSDSCFVIAVGTKIMKIDSNGNLLWNYSLPLSDADYWAMGVTVIEYENGKFIVGAKKASTASQVDYWLVNIADYSMLPTADFQADNTTGASPLSVIFIDSSAESQLGNDIVSWEWDFGDGNTSSLQNPDYIYTTYGMYDVILTVTDESGYSDSEIKENYINVLYNGPVWHVATTGSDTTGDGSEGNPFATIQTGIDAANDGDTVLVAPGTYVENINFNGKNIVVIGEDRETTIIDGNQNGSVVTFNGGEDNTAVLSGFTITNGLASEGGGINCFESSATIYDLIVSYNTALEYGGGVHFYGSSLNNPSLYNSQIIGNNSNGEWWSDGGGIYCLDASVSIFNIEIIYNYATDKGGGIYFNSNNDNLSIQTLTNSIVVQNTSTYGAGIGGYCANMNISNCTISDNNGEGIFYDGGCVDSYNPNIINTIIWNDPSIISSDTVGNFSVSYSDIQWGWVGTGNIDANPLFCNPDSGDFTLAENSPCVGTGENGANMGAFGIGCETILSTDKDVIPLQYVLHQNHPNPFNPVTTLRYDLPENSLVNITIYDMLGRQVKTLVNQTQNAGFKSIIWNATNNYGKPVSAGVYLYKIQAGEFVQTKKMVLLK